MIHIWHIRRLRFAAMQRRWAWIFAGFGVLKQIEKKKNPQTKIVGFGVDCKDSPAKMVVERFRRSLYPRTSWQEGSLSKRGSLGQMISSSCGRSRLPDTDKSSDFKPLNFKPSKALLEAF